MKKTKKIMQSAMVIGIAAACMLSTIPSLAANNDSSGDTELQVCQEKIDTIKDNLEKPCNNVDYSSINSILSYYNLTGKEYSEVSTYNELSNAVKKDTSTNIIFITNNIDVHIDNMEDIEIRTGEDYYRRTIFPMTSENVYIFGLESNNKKPKITCSNAEVKLFGTAESSLVIDNIAMENTLSKEEQVFLDKSIPMFVSEGSWALALNVNKSNLGYYHDIIKAKSTIRNSEFINWNVGVETTIEDALDSKTLTVENTTFDSCDAGVVVEKEETDIPFTNCTFKDNGIGYCVIQEGASNLGNSIFNNCIFDANRFAIRQTTYDNAGFRPSVGEFVEGYENVETAVVKCSDVSFTGNNICFDGVKAKFDDCCFYDNYTDSLTHTEYIWECKHEANNVTHNKLPMTNTYNKMLYAASIQFSGDNYLCNNKSKGLEAVTDKSSLITGLQILTGQDANLYIINNNGFESTMCLTNKTNAWLENLGNISFIKNEAIMGGGIYYTNNLINKGYISFIDNKAEDGGGMYVSNHYDVNHRPLPFTNMYFSGNTATRGGAIFSDEQYRDTWAHNVKGLQIGKNVKIDANNDIYLNKNSIIWLWCGPELNDDGYFANITLGDDDIEPGRHLVRLAYDNESNAPADLFHVTNEGFAARNIERLKAEFIDNENSNHGIDKYDTKDIFLSKQYNISFVNNAHPDVGLSLKTQHYYWNESPVTITTGNRIAECTNTDYALIAWNENEDGSGENIINNFNYDTNDDLTLYATFVDATNHDDALGPDIAADTLPENEELSSDDTLNENDANNETFENSADIEPEKPQTPDENIIVKTGAVDIWFFVIMFSSLYFIVKIVTKKREVKCNED